MDHTRAEKDPLPGKQSVTDAVIDDLGNRREMGVKKYGTELKTHNGRNPMVDAYQEAIDLTLYLKQKLMESESMEQLIHRLLNASDAIVQRWNTMDWKDPRHTGEFINDLKDAVNEVRRAL